MLDNLEDSDVETEADAEDEAPAEGESH